MPRGKLFLVYGTYRRFGENIFASGKVLGLEENVLTSRYIGIGPREMLSVVWGK